MRGRARLLSVALAVGVVDALLFKGFERAVNDGIDVIWNDVFHTDEHRWVVVPLAVALSVALTVLCLVLRQPRLVEPKVGLVETGGDGDDESPTLGAIGVITIIGLGSLLAGASLGPEASLVAISAALGLWIAQRSNLGPAARGGQLASVGGLLVAVAGSFLLVLLPLLILRKKQQLSVNTALPVVLTSASAFGTLWLLDHDTSGFGTIPADSHFSASDVLLAGVLGAVVAVLGWLLKRAITSAAPIAERLSD